MAYGDLKVRNLIWNTGSGDNTIVLSTLATQSYVTTNFAPKNAPTFTGTINGADLILSGNLTVNGTQTIINTQTLDVEDKQIEIGKVSSPSDTTADQGGWKLKGATDKTFLWVNATDAWTSSEHIHLGDTKKLLIGSDSDLRIWHDGSHGYLDNETGWLYVGSDNYIFQNKEFNETHARFLHDGAVELFHNNVKTLATQANGITVLGPEGGSAQINLYSDEGDDNADLWRIDNKNDGILAIEDYSGGSWVTRFRVKQDGKVQIPNDTGKYECGSSGDLSFYHDGNHSRITNNTGQLHIKNVSTYSYFDTDGLYVRSSNGSQGIISANLTSVDLYYSGTKRFETTSSGINVTGAITVNGNALSSAPTVDLVADGAIAANKPVAVQSDGKIKEIKEVISVLGTPVKHSIDWDPSSRSQYVDAVYVPDEQVVVMVFNNDNNYDYGYVTVFSCDSSGNVTRGNTIGLNNAQSTQATSWHRVTWDSTAKRIVCSYKQGGPFSSSSQPRFDTFTVSGLTLTRTAYQRQIHYGTNTNSYHWLGYDPDTQFFIFAVKYDQSNYAYKGYLNRFKIDSSNSMTDFSTSGGRYGPDGDYGVSNETEVDYPAHVMGSNSMIYTIYRSTDNSNKGFVCVKQIQSNGSWYLTKAPRVEIESSTVDSGMAIGYDPDTNKCLAVWSLMSGAVKCCVVSVSGTGTNATLSKGTTITLSNYGLWQSCEYDKTINKMVVKYQNGSQYPCIRYVTISGTTATAGNELVLYNTAGTNAGDLVDHGVYSLAHFENVGKMTGWFAADSNRTLENVPFYGGTAVTTLSSGYIGISSAAINDTATGSIAVTGNTNASLSGLTAGAKHYVQKDGSFKTTPEPTLTVEAGIALSSTKLLIKG